MTRRLATENAIPRPIRLLLSWAAGRQLRALGFAGRLIMISREQRRPYDRTLLSKMYLSGLADSKQLPLHPRGLLKNCEFLVAEVRGIDSQNHVISFEEGRPALRYKLLVATGGKPQQLVLSQSARRPLVLRSVEDADRLIAAAEKAAHAVLVGASFISMEVASAFQERGLRVTVVSREKIPLLKQLGPQMGQLLLEKHLEKGVSFLPETEVVAINEGRAGPIVKLSNDQELPADLVVSGLGIEPCTDFLKGISLNEDHSIPVDPLRRLSEDVFAASDVAEFPLSGGRRTRIEHWRVAQQQAMVAASNMMGLEQPYQGVPYFWTYHYGTRFEFFGRMDDRAQLRIDGDPKQSRCETPKISSRGTALSCRKTTGTLWQERRTGQNIDPIIYALLVEYPIQRCWGHLQKVFVDFIAG